MKRSRELPRLWMLLSAFCCAIAAFTPALAQEGPSQSVPAEDEVETGSPRLFPELKGSESQFYDPKGKTPGQQRDAIEQVIAEHREAEGEFLKVAILEAPLQGLDAQGTANQLFSEWQKDPELLKEREALLVIYTESRESRIEFTYDLEHLLKGETGERIMDMTREALSRGVDSAAATGVLQLLRALSSPIVDQGRVPEGLRALVEPRTSGASPGFAWALLVAGLLCLSGFALLLSYQEIHISSDGAHRIRPHEQLKNMMNSLRARLGERRSEGPGAAITGDW